MKKKKAATWWSCGHPRTPENTYKGKWETCYECKRRRWLEYEAKKDSRDTKLLLEELWKPMWIENLAEAACEQ